MDKQWIIKERAPKAQIEPLAASLSIEPVLANLLLQRGVTSFDEAKAYFRPSLDDLHDPFLMLDMDKAFDRLQKAIDNNERILFYGDYDVDGTTAVSLCYLFFKKRYSKIGYYIPDRYKEGYGVSMAGINYAAQNGYTLIITLDCGIKANIQIEYAAKQGIDVIVCDHHNEGSEIPQALAVLDPKRSNCKYPFKELSGCGVAFKLLQAWCLRNNVPLEENLFCYLDIVAVSIASDIVPIIGENRILSSFGLKQIIEKPTNGITAIKEVAGIKGVDDLSISDIVFKIGPRINAAGRIDNGTMAVSLLVAENHQQAMSIVSEIDTCNSIRKDIDKSITEDAISIIASKPELQNKKTTVLFNHEWHKGVIGIVASRLIEHYYRPTVILTESNGKITGSARSVDGFDLYAAIEACSDLLENFGGHKFAAGVTLKQGCLQQFIDKFEAVVSASILPDQLIPKIKIDAEINFGEITPKFYRIMRQFQPFGPENMTPVFITRNLMDAGSKRVGRDLEHLKVSAKDPNRPIYLDGIAFGMGHLYEKVVSEAFDLCYTIENNTFRGE